MTVNEKMNSSQYPYEACLIPALDEKLQHQIRDISNYVVLPLDMIMAATSLILNTVICMTVIGTRSLRHPSLLLLCSLAVTDLLWALATLIYYTFVLRDPYMCPENGEEVVLVGNFFFLATLSNLTTISRDRYLAISKPLWYRAYSSTSRVVKVIIFNWLLSALIPVLLYWFKLKNMSLVIYFEGAFYLLFTVLVLVIVYNYVGSLLVSRRYARNIQMSIGQIGTVVNREKKITRMISVIILCFFFSFLPGFLTPLLLIALEMLSEGLVRFSGLLFTLNGLLNPLINFAGNKDIRRAIRVKFMCRRQRVHPPNQG